MKKSVKQNKASRLRSSGPLFLAVCLTVYVVIVLACYGWSGSLAAWRSEDLPDFSTGWKIVRTDEDVKLDELGKAAGSDEEVKIYNYLPDTLSYGENLIFESDNIFFKVKIGGDDVYNYTEKPFVLAGRSYGYAFHSIGLGRRQAGVRVEMTVYPAYQGAGGISEISVGSSGTYMTHLFARFLPAFVISILIITLGVTMLYISYGSSNLKTPLVDSFRMFSLTAILFGTWSLVESRVPIVLTPCPDLWRCFTFTMLMIVPYPAVRAANAWMIKPNPKIDHFFLAVVIFNVVVCTGAYILFHLDLWQCRLLIHAALILSIAVMCIMSVDQIVQYKRNHIHNPRREILWVIILLDFACMIVDLARYAGYGAPEDAARYSRIGFLMLMLVLIMVYKSEMIIHMKKSLEADVYHMMAYKDVMTGFYNRSALSEVQENLGKEMASGKIRDLIIVYADLNFLKRVNDHYGHQAGDDYIIRCAHMLQDSFGRYGRLFRLGGDEFMAVLDGEDVFADYDKGELALLDLLAKQTPDAKMPPVSLSWGFAISRKEKPVTMEKLESMADARMYEMKVQMKAERLD